MHQRSAYNLGNFLCTLATPEPIKDWSLTSLTEKLIKIGAKVVSHGRYVAFQMAEVAIGKRSRRFAVDYGTTAATAVRAIIKRPIVTRSSITIGGVRPNASENSQSNC